MNPARVIMGITGASGVIYGKVLLEELLKLDLEIHLIVSQAARLVMQEELGMPFVTGAFDPEAFLGRRIPRGRVILYDDTDLAAGPASGTFRSRGMVICPCSMKTLATLASGTGSSLITRAADACLKERRRLVLVPRETPLNLIHLRAMVAVTEAGAIVLPASPGFYHRPETIDQLIRHIALKVLDILGLEHDIPFRWKDLGERD
ncbi:MAG: UbiX family flavin prenyltransferase [Candidatus Sumerlaeaceae bacterium]|nr:UbiX family flavin prenyltransferase [Candidatus Sumerlaeaceae bacterium]